MLTGDGPLVGVVGSCNVDYVVRVEHLARPGETVRGGDVVRLFGGKGANQAVAAARLGARVSLLGCVGEDADGAGTLEALRSSGVDVSGVSRSPRPTGSAFIAVDGAGENTIVVSPGANADVDVARGDLESFDVVLAQLEVPEAVIEQVAARARRCVLNVAPYREVPSGTLAACAVLIANRVEAEGLALEQLAHVVITEGAQGARHLRFGREVARVGAPRLEVHDTVGAGDAFCAAYAVQFARGADAYDALAYAVVAGALATRATGARGSLPTHEEVRAWRDDA